MHTRRAALVLSLAALTFLGACSRATTRQHAVRGSASAIRALHDADDPRVLVVAHRGLTRDHPENSLGAIRAAADAGIDIVEIDVRLTADGVAVLMHDKTLDRTTTGTGPIAERTLAQVRELQLLDGLRPTSERVPTLSEAFGVARGRVLLNLDPKAMSIPDAADLARAAGVLDHCIFKQRWDRLDAELFDWLRSNPDVCFMPICDGLPQTIDALNAYPWPAVEVLFDGPDDPLADPAVIDQLRSRGVRVWLNTLWDGRLAGGRSNGLSDYDAASAPLRVFEKVRLAGFGIVQTDLPDRAASVLAE